MMSDFYWVSDDSGIHLEHHGIKGQRKGRRRWQNEDGSLTPEGRVHYGVGEKEKSHFSNEQKKYMYDTEELEMQNGKKLTIDAYGMYRYAKNEKEVADIIKGNAFSSKSWIGEMKKHDPKLSAEMRKVNKGFYELAKKYGNVRYKDIDFKQLKKEENALTNREMSILTEYTRKHMRF